MRRADLERARIQLPALATIALGALPDGIAWPTRLERIGLDVVASGAAVDTPDTWRAAQAVVPFRPAKAIAGDPAGLITAGCRLIEAPAPVDADVYWIGPDERMVIAVDGSRPEVEDPNVVARAAVEMVRTTGGADIWVAASAGLDRLPVDVVEAKLRALVETAVQARMVFAKEQFDI